jgi:hypothetical protein
LQNLTQSNAQKLGMKSFFKFKQIIKNQMQYFLEILCLLMLPS